MVEVRLSRLTSNRIGTRSASAATWVTTPTIRLPWARFSSVPATISSASGSRVPKPSSRKIESSVVRPPAASVDSCSDRASARARLAWKVSPPDRVFTERRGVGVGVVDHEELAPVVGELELTAGQLQQGGRGIGHQGVQCGVGQPLRETAWPTSAAAAVRPPARSRCRWSILVCSRSAASPLDDRSRRWRRGPVRAATPPRWGSGPSDPASVGTTDRWARLVGRSIACSSSRSRTRRVGAPRSSSSAPDGAARSTRSAVLRPACRRPRRSVRPGPG